LTNTTKTIIISQKRGIFFSVHTKAEKMEQPLVDLKIDKTMFSVVSLAESSEDKAYWLAKSPTDRLRQVETLRRINYGHSATGRLQRVLEVVERPGC